ncbi:MAG TPA: DUF1631 domain-containing protein [Usitatibacter sp.]|nr:DUF1631 domain-containing protein [Usitatibacter sp.]
MAQPANGNVVPLGEHPRAKARLTARESADVLTDCRQLALDRMARSLAGMLDRVEDDLFELSEKAPDREAQNTYLDARAKAREKRPAIEAAFRSQFVEFFNRKVRGESAAPAHAPAPAYGELALVAPEELEESIAMREMSRKLGAACEGELFALSQRMGFLLERPGLEEEANPLSPSTVFAALQNACEQIGASFKVKLTLLRQLESYAEAELQDIYRDLNEHLVERRILPEVRVAVRKSAASQPRPDRPAAPKAPATPNDIFGTLAQLLGAAMPGGNPLAQGAGGAPSAIPASFLSELTRMHREGAAAQVDGSVPVNVVKGIRTAPQSASLPALDAMTIDLVSMLFDYIFEDRHIPTSVKAWLGRLQIPTLKVALLDKNFFSSKAHPARRLIDRLAECAIGLDEANADGSGCIAMVEAVVGRILADFDTDIALFESQLGRVEAFIEERKRAEAELVERSARLVEEREREEIARTFAEDEVARRLQASPWVPAIVREALEGPWVRALAAARLVEGEASPTWQLLVKTMEDLAWSVEPKSQPEERKRLVAILPGMLKNVVEGLRRGGIDDAARDAFLGALVDCHAGAVKSGLRGMAALPEVPVPPRREAPAIEREMVPAGGIRMEEIRLRSRGIVRNVFTRTGIWTNLQRGTWVEFCGAPGAKRARLTWISPNKGVYLFTNPLSAEGAVSISPEALAEQMRLGEARMLDDAPLVDRAVGSMLATLREGAASAQG